MNELLFRKTSHKDRISSESWGWSYCISIDYNTQPVANNLPRINRSHAKRVSQSRANHYRQISALFLLLTPRAYISFVEVCEERRFELRTPRGSSLLLGVAFVLTTQCVFLATLQAPPWPDSDSN